MGMGCILPQVPLVPHLHYVEITTLWHSPGEIPLPKGCGVARPFPVSPGLEISN